MLRLRSEKNNKIKKSCITTAVTENMSNAELWGSDTTIIGSRTNKFKHYSSTTENGPSVLKGIKLCTHEKKMPRHTHSWLNATRGWHSVSCSLEWRLEGVDFLRIYEIEMLLKNFIRRFLYISNLCLLFLLTLGFFFYRWRSIFHTKSLQFTQSDRLKGRQKERKGVFFFDHFSAGLCFCILVWMYRVRLSWYISSSNEDRVGITSTISNTNKSKKLQIPKPSLHWLFKILT